ncbi:MAG: hypothetical protein RR452_10200, partial [Clostridia bacterium]
PCATPCTIARKVAQCAVQRFVKTRFRHPAYYIPSRAFRQPATIFGLLPGRRSVIMKAKIPRTSHGLKERFS